MQKKLINKLFVEGLVLILLVSAMSSILHAEIIKDVDINIKNYPEIFKENNDPQFDSKIDYSENNVFLPNELIIKFNNKLKQGIMHSNKGFVITGLNSIDILNERFKINKIEKIFNINEDSILSSYYKLTIPPEVDMYSVISEYKSNAYVDSVQPHYLAKTALVPNDPRIDEQWALENIQAFDGWNLSIGDKSVVVAVIDSGITVGHEDLNENIWINQDEIPDNEIDDDYDGFIDNIYGADFANDDGDPSDINGHGTICSGVISAVGNNNKGIAGVAWNITIIPVRSLIGGFGFIDDLCNGIVWAADNGADVISNSWIIGKSIEIPMVIDAVKYAYDKGCVVVFAAGNDNDNIEFYSPQNMFETIAVAATDENDEKWSKSSWGDKIDVCAPGYKVLTTVKSSDMSYEIRTGTSIACPFVSGLAGLLLSKNSSLTPDMVKTIIRNSVDDVNSSVPIGGRINVFKAIQCVPSLAIIHPFDDWTDVNGTIEIMGSAWSTEFQYYCLEYRKAKSEDIWIEIVNSSNPVKLGILASWDTSTVSDDHYDLRLKVVNDKTYIDILPVIVNNEYNLYKVDDDNVAGPWDGSEIHPFQHIQDALYMAGRKDEIFVKSGIYYENVVIERSNNIIGEDKHSTIIDGREKTSVIQILADNVKVSGFTIKNSSHYHISGEKAGIHIMSDNNKIIDNILTDNRMGIYVFYPSYLGAPQNNQILNNEIVGNTYFSVCIEDKASNTAVIGNYIQNSGGILIEAADYSTIQYNFFCDINNRSYGSIIVYNLFQSPLFSHQSYGGYGTTIIDNIILSKEGRPKWESDMSFYFSYSVYEEGMLEDYELWDSLTVDNNTLDSQYIRYYKHEKDLTVPSDTARVILFGCHNIIMKNLFLNEVRYGIRMIYSSYCSIIDCEMDNNIKAGIYVESFSHNNTIEGNTVKNLRSYAFGMLLDNTNYNNLTKNSIIDSNSLKNGLQLFSSDNNIITNNYFLNHTSNAIDFSVSNLNTVSENTIKNTVIGLSIHPGSFTSIDKNYFSGNKKAIDIMSGSIFNMISNNQIIDNAGGIYLIGEELFNTIKRNKIIGSNYHGIELTGETHCTISDNIVKENQYGIVLKASNNKVFRNELNNNTWQGFYIRGSNNTIYHNNFISNNPNAKIDSNNILDNGYPSGGNYWDDYNGTDTDGDGIGDIPYIVKDVSGEVSGQDNYPLMKPFTDKEPPVCAILQPEKALYIGNNFIMDFFVPVAIGEITVIAEAFDAISEIHKVEFFVDGKRVNFDTEPPYTYTWTKKDLLHPKHTLRIDAYDANGNIGSDELVMWKLF